MSETMEEIAERFFEILSGIVERKNYAIMSLSARSPLYITKQVDIPGCIKIDIDYPTENARTRNQYIVQLVFHLNDSGIDLTLCGATPVMRFTLFDQNMALRVAGEHVLLS